MIDVFATLDEAWVALLADLQEAPVQRSRNGMTREIMGYAFCIDPRCNVLLNERRCISPAYASAELLWYLSRSDKVDYLLPYAPQYARFAEEDGTAFGAYGKRIGDTPYGDQLELAKQLLKEAPETRQCIVQLWSPRDLFHVNMYSKKDLPCTICWQFLVRDGRLDMIVYMRSNDAWLGTPYDVYCFTSIQKLMAGDLGLEVGWYTHMVGSMHLYEKNFDAALEAWQEGVDKITPPVFDGYMQPQKSNDVKAAVAQAASDYQLPHAPEIRFDNTLLCDSMACMQHFRNKTSMYAVVSPALRQAMFNWEKRQDDNRRRNRSTGQDNDVP